MAAATSVPRPPALPRWVLPTVAVPAAAATVLAAAEGSGLHLTRYAETSPLALAADLTAGLAMIAAGAVLGVVRPGAPAVLALLVGCAWSAPGWIGAEQAPPAVRSAAMVAAPVLLPLVVHLALAWPDGRLPSRGGRAAVVTAYGLTAAVSLGLAAVRDPVFDRHCWQNCTANVFLLRADIDAAQALTALAGWVAVLTCLGLLAGLRRGSTAPATTRAVPVLAAAVAAAEGGYALLRLTAPDAEPVAGAFPAVFLVRAGVLLALAVAIATPALRTLRTRAAVDRLGHDLAVAPAPGQLRAVLARSLDDERLAVAYWLEGPDRYVDADGRPVDPHPAADQVGTTIARDGRPVAVVVHDRRLRERARHLQQAIGSAARLAVENERLRAEALYRLEDVRASQARVVARSDATRRALERDLHDGAQQRLLAVSFQLHAAQAAARADGDPAELALLARANEEAVAALAEVRQLAHGIFPAILADAGLVPALRTFAAGSGLPVELLDVAEERCDPAVETAAYVVVVEAVADAVRRSAGYAAVRVVRDGGVLAVVVTDDGAPAGHAGLRHVADRVEALGGCLRVDAATVRAELPCG